MSLLPLVTGADSPILRSKTQEVPQVTKEIKKLIKDMQETMIKEEGVGLAAPQVGRTERLCLARINGKITGLINPQITWRSEETKVDEEGCLSLPKIYVKVPRAIEITVEYLDESGSAQERRLSGLDARIVQHELDHLEGVLIVDYKLPITSPIQMAQKNSNLL
jgi:peptide deformylase